MSLVDKIKMDMLRKCKGCGKQIDAFIEGNSVPVSIAATPSFNMPSGGVDMYCDECYKGMTLEPEKPIKPIEESSMIKLKKYRETHNIKPISEIEENTPVEILAIVASPIETKQINDKLKVGECYIEDDSSQVKLVLWNDSIKGIHKDKTYKIIGYAKKFNQELQITLGYKGSCKEINLD